jgi:hypothetical protein
MELSMDYAAKKRRMQEKEEAFTKELDEYVKRMLRCLK